MGKYIILLLMFMQINTTKATMIDIQDFIMATNTKLSAEEAKEIKEAIYHYAVAHNIEPRLLAAIAAVESRFNRKATGKVGEIGMCQLRPEFHLLSIVDKEHRVTLLYSINYNLGTAAEYLQGLKLVFESRYPNLDWVNFYNTGPSAKPKKFTYANKVRKYYAQLGGTIERQHKVDEPI